MEKTKAKPVLTETGNSDAESTGLTNAAQIARKLNNEDKEIDMSKFHKSNFAGAVRCAGFCFVIHLLE